MNKYFIFKSTQNLYNGKIIECETLTISCIGNAIHKQIQNAKISFKQTYYIVHDEHITLFIQEVNS